MESTTQTDFSDRILLTVHGVASENTGLANLRAHCEAKLPGLVADSYFYEKVVPYRAMDSSLTSFLFRSVWEKIQLVCLKNTNRKLFIIAHSFGTLAVLRALQMQIPEARIEGLVLLGSIIPRNQVWDGFIGNDQLTHPPLAVIRPFDKVVPLAVYVGGEESGALGFISIGVHTPLQTFKTGGHTAYDPDDFDDVAQAIAHGVRSVERKYKDYDSWYQQLGSLKKIRYRLGF